MFIEPWIEIRVLDAIAFGASLLAASAIVGFIRSGEAASLVHLDRLAAAQRARRAAPAGAPKLESL